MKKHIPNGLHELKAYVANFKTQRKAAAKLGVVPQHLSDILHGRRELSEEMAKNIGFRKITIFEKIK